HSPLLQGAIDGLFYALAAWRSVAVRLSHLPKDVARQEVDAILRAIPPELRSAQARQTTSWTEHPSGMPPECDAAAPALQARPSGTPSLRLLAAHVANLLAGFTAVLDGLALLVADRARIRSRPRLTLHVPDWLPALVNGARAFATIGAVEVLWIATAWP